MPKTAADTTTRNETLAHLATIILMSYTARSSQQRAALNAAAAALAREIAAAEALSD